MILDELGKQPDSLLVLRTVKERRHIVAQSIEVQLPATRDQTGSQIVSALDAEFFLEIGRPGLGFTPQEKRVEKIPPHGPRP